MKQNIIFMKNIRINKFIILHTLVIFATVITSCLSDKQSVNSITIVPGEQVKTYGFADTGEMKYGSNNFILIDDKTYPDMNSKVEAFRVAVSGNNFVIIDGDIDLSCGKITDEDHGYFDEFNTDNTPKHKNFVVTIGSNTTLIGMETARIMYGSLLIHDEQNIIIQNISFYDAHGAPEQNPKINKETKCSADNISAEKVKNLWIDHCSFADGKCVDVYGTYHDGAVDIKSGKNITISYCYFTNHDKVMLLTPSDDFTDKTNVYLTLHHNYFNKIVQRAPRARRATVHAYNNLYENIGYGRDFGYSLGIGIGSNFIVENNYFGKHKSGIICWFDKSDINDKNSSKLYYHGNLPNLKNKNSIYSEIDKMKDYKLHVKKEKMYDIPYTYELESVKEIKKNLKYFAGANKKVEILTEDRGDSNNHEL